MKKISFKQSCIIRAIWAQGNKILMFLTTFALIEINQFKIFNIVRRELFSTFKKNLKIRLQLV